jgi:hypothetical protein
MDKLSLIKIRATQWQGNGFGTASALWAVKGHEHITVSKICNRWYALDNNAHKRIASSYDRTHLVDLISEKLGETQ